IGQRDGTVVVGVQVDRLPIGVRVQEGEVVRESTLKLHEQPVVVERTFALDLADRAQGWRELYERTVHVGVGHPYDRWRLVRVSLDQHLPALRADVGDLYHVVRRQGLL